jgi:tape measure domain-containing protein
MAVGPLEQAYIEIEARTTGVDQSLDDIEGRLEAIEHAARAASEVLEDEFQRAGEIIEDAMREAARASDEALSDIGGGDVFATLQFEAESTGEAIENAIAEAARSADESLGDIGGGSFAGLRAEAEITGEAVESSFREAARQSDAHLRGINAGSLGLLSTGLFSVAAAAGVAGAATVGFGLKGAAALEQTQIGFESLLGSAEEADAFIRDLQQFAANTPFEFQGLADNARRLLAVGEAAGITRDEILPTLTTLGDLVAVLGAPAESIDRVNTALAQMASKGKVSTEELLQLGEALPGFPVFKALADGLGLTGEQLQDKLQAGAIGAEEGISALLDGMKEFPGAAGAMSKQAQTLSGVFSTFKDTISLGLTEAFQPLVPTIKESLADAVPAIEASLATIAPALSGITGGLFGGIGLAVATLGPALGDTLQGLADSFEPLKAVGADLLTSLAGPLSQLGPLISSIVTALAPLIGVIATAVSTFLPPFIAFLTEIADALAPVIAGFASFASEVLEALGPAFTTILGSVSIAVSSLTPAFQGIDSQPFVDLASAFADLLVAIEPIIPPLTALAVLIIANLAEAITIAVDILATLVQFLADNEAALIAFTGVVAALLVPAFIAWATAAASAAVATLTAMSPIVLIGAAIAALVVGVIWAYQNLDFFRTAVDAVGQAAVWLWNEVLVPFAGFLAETFGTVVSSISSFFTDTLVPALSTVAGVALSLWNDVLVPFGTFLLSVLIPVFQVLTVIVLAPLIIAITTVSIVATSLWQFVLVPFAGFLAGVFGPVLTAVAGVLAFVLGGAISGVAALASWLWNSVLVPFGSFLGAVFSFAAGVAASALRGIGSAASAVGGFLADLWHTYGEPIAEFFVGAFSLAVGAVSGAFGAMSDAVSGVLGFLGDLIDKAGSVVDAVGGIADAISNLPGGGILDSIGGALGFGAHGGIFTGPTPMIIGEAGPEVLIPLTDPRRAASLTQASGLLDVLAQAGAFGPQRAASTPQAASSGPGATVFNMYGDVVVPGAGSQREADQAGAAFVRGANRELARRKIRNDALTA